MSGKKWFGKERMDGHYPPAIVSREKFPPTGNWRKRYECKPLRGDHLMRVFRVNVATWQRDPLYWVEWRCEGCRHSKLEWKAPDPKFDKYRKNIRREDCMID